MTEPEPEAETEQMPELVRIMPGPLGLDSPVVPPPGTLMPLSRWHAWFDLVNDRSQGQPSPRFTITDALGRPPFEKWGLWWLTHHSAIGRELLHRARVSTVDGGGEMLLAACGLSLPWTGPSENIAPRKKVPEEQLPPQLARCTVCAENDPDSPVHRQGEHEWRGGEPRRVDTQETRKYG